MSYDHKHEIASSLHFKNGKLPVRLGIWEFLTFMID
jgi:hypothetical protein